MKPGTLAAFIIHHQVNSFVLIATNHHQDSSPFPLPLHYPSPSTQSNKLLTPSNILVPVSHLPHPPPLILAISNREGIPPLRSKKKPKKNRRTTRVEGFSSHLGVIKRER